MPDASRLTAHRGFEVDPDRETARSRLLRCSPADFGTGSDRAWRDGHRIASTSRFVNINPVVGGCAGGDVGEGAAGRRRRSSTYPRAFCFVGLARHAIAQALVRALVVIQHRLRTPTGRCFVSFCIPGIRGSRVASPFMGRSESRRASFSAAR